MVLLASPHPLHTRRRRLLLTALPLTPPPEPQPSHRRYNWASEFNADGSAGPDGGTLPGSAECDFLFHSSRDGGSDADAGQWQTIPYPGSQPYCMPEKCDGEALKAGECSKQCCAYCLADKDCVEARLEYDGAPGCVLIHAGELQFGPATFSHSTAVSLINQFKKPS